MDRGTKVGPTSTVYKSDRALAAGSVVGMDKKPAPTVSSTTKPVRSKSTSAAIPSSNGSGGLKWNSGSSSSSVGLDGKQNSTASLSSSVDLGERRNSTLTSSSIISGAKRNSSTFSKVGREKGGVPARVRVAVRIRPRNAEEMAADVDLADCLELQPETKKLKLRKNNWDCDTYQFDEVLTETSSQKRVYEVVAKPVVESVCQGYNGTVMAYGQSGTGKTFTLGRLGEEDIADRGIMVRALEDILADVNSSEGTVTVSYLQLYMESVQDLLDPGKKDSIAIVEDSKTGDVSVPGATQVELKDQRSFMRLLEAGEANRLAANTKLNTESSRSHAILLVNLKKVVKPNMGDLNENGDSPHLDHGMQASIVRKSKLLIVDLAGSERIDKSGSEGHMLEEAKFINLSLTALGKCINAIAENSPHVPIRDSKLTRMLRDSFGGTARTSLIVTIGPSPRHRGETASTISFGQRAMKVENVSKLKEEFDYRSLCRKLETELDRVTADYERQCKAKQEAIEHFERRLEEDAEAAADRLATALKTREQAEGSLRKENADVVDKLKRAEKELKDIAEENLRLGREQAERDKDFERRLEEGVEAAADRLATVLNAREHEEGKLRKENADTVDKLKKAEKELKDIAEENLRLEREQAERDKDFQRRLEEDAEAAADRLATALKTREQEEGSLRKENEDMVDKLKRAEKELKDIAEENLRLGREQAERDKDFERRLEDDAEAAAIALNTREQEEGRLKKEYADMVDKLKRAEKELKDIAEENLRLGREQAERDKDFERRLEEDAEAAADRLAIALNTREQEEERLKKEYADMVNKLKQAEKELKDIAEENGRLEGGLEAESGSLQRELPISNRLLLEKQSLEKSPEVQNLQRQLEMEIQPCDDLEHKERPLKQIEKLQNEGEENENEVILSLNGKLEEEFKQREILEEKVRSLKEQLTLFSYREDDSIGEFESDRSSEGSQGSSIHRPVQVIKAGHRGDHTIHHAREIATASKLYEQVGLLKISSLLESEDLDVRVHAINVVARLAAEEANQEKIVEVGGLDSLLFLLDNSDHETIGCAAAGAIANLAMSQIIQEHIASRGGIGILARATHDARNPQTLRVVGGAIANLCGNENLLVKLKEEGGIRALLRMGRSRHSGVLAQVARGIANFSKCESKWIARGYQSTRSWLLDDGALPWIVANANNEASPIRCHIEIALCHLARHEVNSKDLIGGGALSELVRISQESGREDIRNLAQRTLNASNSFQTQLQLDGYVHLVPDSTG